MQNLTIKYKNYQFCNCIHCSRRHFIAHIVTHDGIKFITKKSVQISVYFWPKIYTKRWIFCDLTSPSEICYILQQNSFFKGLWSHFEFFLLRNLNRLVQFPLKILYGTILKEKFKGNGFCCAFQNNSSLNFCLTNRCK